jgi:hypothetical protein
MFHFRENVSKLHPVHICSVTDPGCLSRILIFSIPDPRSKRFRIRIRIKAVKYFNPKKWFLSSSKYDPGCSPWIRVLIFFYPSRIQGSKRHRIPDPGPQNCIYLVCRKTEKEFKRPRLPCLLVICEFFQDESAKILEEKARESGVNVVYQTSDFPTGAPRFLSS